MRAARTCFVCGCRGSEIGSRVVGSLGRLGVIEEKRNYLRIDKYATETVIADRD